MTVIYSILHTQRVMIMYKINTLKMWHPDLHKFHQFLFLYVP